MPAKNVEKIQKIVDAMAVSGIIDTGAGVKITGNQIADTIMNIPKKTSITTGHTANSITFTAERGYYPAAVSTELTKYIGANVVTPSAGATTLTTKNKYVTSNVTIRGDANLISANIKSGVSIFGISGTYSGSSITTMRGSFRSTSRNFIFSATNYDQQMNQIDFINISNETLTYSGIILDSIVVFTNNGGTAPPYYNNGLVLLNSSAQTTPRIFYFRVVSNFSIEM